jgi:lipopolysaccharide transport protein LptA
MPVYAATIEKQPDHSPKHMTISSDSAMIKFKEKTYIFSGNVHIKTEDTNIDGDKVIGHQNQLHKFTYMFDYGNPAHYYSIIDPKQPPLDATARIIKYFPPLHRAILINHALARQGANAISSPILHYNTQEKILRTKKVKNNRTHIMIDSQGNLKMP